MPDDPEVACRAYPIDPDAGAPQELFDEMVACLRASVADHETFECACGEPGWADPNPPGACWPHRILAKVAGASGGLLG